MLRISANYSDLRFPGLLNKDYIYSRFFVHLFYNMHETTMGALIVLPFIAVFFRMKIQLECRSTVFANVEREFADFLGLTIMLDEASP